MRKLLYQLSFAFIFFTTTNAQGVQQLWGTTIYGGTDGAGTIFSLKHDGAGFQKRHDFKTSAEGFFPNDTELLEYNNKYYGVTELGGPYGTGVLFEWDPVTNIYVKKAHFDSNTAYGPRGILALLNNKIYGVGSGGTNSNGVIFEYDLATNTLSKEYEFVTANGKNPVGGIIQYNNKLYGLTNQGGTNNSGVVYTYDPATNTYTKIKDFDGSDIGDPTFSNSLSFFNNKIYGLTRKGTNANGGAVLFEIDPLTNSFAKKIEFGTGSFVVPIGNLSEFSGKLYGMSNNSIFEYNPVLNTVEIKYTLTNFADGLTPSCSRLILSNSKFYGATKEGGASFSGVLFEWDPVANTYIKKTDFIKTDQVFSGLVAKNNIIYGLQGPSGISNFGRIFKYDIINTQFNIEFDFLEGINGVLSAGGLLYKNGKLYGTTTSGGINKTGVIYEFNRNTNSYIKKKDFEPMSSVFLDVNTPYLEYNNKLYGVISANSGQLYEWDPGSNILTTKIQFSSNGSSYLNGLEPTGELVLANGKIYGVTRSGGVNWYGTIYEWNPTTNIHTKKYDFSSSSGAYPLAITQKNSKFFGITATGGSNNNGVIFEWDAVTNIYTVKFNFSSLNGSSPSGPWIEYNNKFYGLASEGGTNNLGVLYEWDPATNIFTKKSDFDGVNGKNPVGKLLISNGKFYGAAGYAGSDNSYDYGSVFEWDPTSNTLTNKHNFTGLNGAVCSGYLQVIPALVASSNPNTCTTFPSVTIDNTNNNQWVPITNQYGDVVAEIKSNGNNLGTLSTSLYVNSGPVREDASKKLYLDRSLTIAPQTQPTTPVDIRLYITEAEFNALKNATNSQGQPSGISSINDIGIFKNNDACNNQIIAATTQVNAVNIVYDGGGYVITCSVNSFSSFYFANKTGSPLPLTLLSFSSKLRNNNAELEWKTANEYNTDEFVIQRSTDGRNYQNIGIVKANNSNGIHSYQFTDVSVNTLGKQVLYYRLLQKDINSKLTYSNITSVTFGLISDVIEWPNPVTNQLNLLFTTIRKEKISIRIVDMNGRVIKQEEFTADKGSVTKSYDLNNLEKGNYVVEVYSESIKKQFKIVKQ